MQGEAEAEEQAQSHTLTPVYLWPYFLCSRVLKKEDSEKQDSSGSHLNQNHFPGLKVLPNVPYIKYFSLPRISRPWKFLLLELISNKQFREILVGYQESTPQGSGLLFGLPIHCSGTPQPTVCKPTGTSLTVRLCVDSASARLPPPVRPPIA